MKLEDWAGVGGEAGSSDCRWGVRRIAARFVLYFLAAFSILVVSLFRRRPSSTLTKRTA